VNLNYHGTVFMMSKTRMSSFFLHSSKFTDQTFTESISWASSLPWANAVCWNRCRLSLVPVTSLCFCRH